MSRYEVRGVPTAEVLEQWPRLHKWAEKMERRASENWREGEILKGAVAGENQLHAIIRWPEDEVVALIITEIVGNQVSMIGVAGEGRKEWQDHGLGEIEKWAKSLGAEKLVLYARPGWKSLLQSRKYRVSHVEFTKLLA